MSKQQKKTQSLEGRIARFDNLSTIAVQRGHALPQEVADLIWARQLLPVVTRGDGAPGPFGTEAPISGAGDMSITYAVCPPGTGPSLHAHRATFETFTVLKGKFRFSSGENGGETVELDPFDTLSVPPGVFRAFRNIGEGEGVLQVIITGGIHDVDDVYFPAGTAREVAAHGAQHLEYLKKSGMYFEDET